MTFLSGRFRGRPWIFLITFTWSIKMMMMIMMMWPLPNGWAASGVTAGWRRKREDPGTATDHKIPVTEKLPCPAHSRVLRCIMPVKYVKLWKAASLIPSDQQVSCASQSLVIWPPSQKAFSRGPGVSPLYPREGLQEKLRGRVTQGAVGIKKEIPFQNAGIFRVLRTATVLQNQTLCLFGTWKQKGKKWKRMPAVGDKIPQESGGKELQEGRTRRSIHSSPLWKRTQVALRSHTVHCAFWVQRTVVRVAAVEDRLQVSVMEVVHAAAAQEDSHPSPTASGILAENLIRSVALLWG